MTQDEEGYRVEQRRSYERKQTDERAALLDSQRGERLKAARIGAGLTTGQAAAQMTWSVSQIEAFEVYGRISEENIKNFSIAYGVSPDWLMHGTRTELDPALTAELSKLSPDDQRRVAGLLSILRKD